MKQPRPYQVEGAEFLAGGGKLLADAPGTGKTFQAILACQRTGARRILVVCPAVALAVWRDEIKDCWPECVPAYLRDAVTKKKGSNGSSCFAIITGYEYLLVNKRAQRIVARVAEKYGKFDAIICDEAHALKNPLAKRTILIYGAGCDGSGLVSMARHVWLLTGTPMLNHPGELFPHVRALDADRLPAKSYQGHVARYCTTKLRRIYLPPRAGMPGKSKDIEVIDGANRAELPDLVHRLRGFWIKRKVDDQLPPLTVSTRSIDPSECDMRLLKEAEDSDEAAELRAALASGDVERLKDLEIHLATLRRLLALAKVPAAVRWVEDILDQGVDKVCLWGWHVEALESASKSLADHGVAMILGETPSKERELSVRRFQQDPACRVFVGQIQAAGQAITLTAARREVFIEQAWTPAMNWQALKRCHRIGQAWPVQVDVLAVDGSIDHAVQEILARKSADIALLEDA